MKSFEYAAPKTLKEAVSLLSDQWGETEILAGGTDLVTSLKQGLTAPRRLVSLKNIGQLKGLKTDAETLRIGAMTTLEELRGAKTVKDHFPALRTALEGVASSQIRAAGTVGGDLCQRPRCWYYRNGFGLLGQQAGRSLVRDGDNRYHAVFGTEGPALFVSPSSLGPPLVALGARVVLAGPGGKERTLPVAEFFQTPKAETDRETTLKPNEILTEILVPLQGLRNATYEVRHRHGLDWPYVTASVAFQLKDGTASQARVILGHVAPVPWPAARAAEVLTGARVDGALAARCGETAAAGAKPLSKNAYKVQMVKAAVKRAVLAAAQA